MCGDLKINYFDNLIKLFYDKFTNLHYHPFCYNILHAVNRQKNYCARNIIISQNNIERNYFVI